MMRPLPLLTDGNGSKDAFPNRVGNKYERASTSYCIEEDKGKMIMRKALLSLCAVFALFATQPLFADDTPVWEVDKQQTGFELAKLGFITLVPVTCFILSATALPEHRDTWFWSGVALSVPALTGLTLFTIDFITYDPNEYEALLLPATAPLEEERDYTLRLAITKVF